MLAVCVAIALAAKVVFQVVRASLRLQRQFKGPPSSSLLLGDLTNLPDLIVMSTKQNFLWTRIKCLTAIHMQPASGGQSHLAFSLRRREHENFYTSTEAPSGAGLGKHTRADRAPAPGMDQRGCRQCPAFAASALPFGDLSSAGPVHTCSDTRRVRAQVAMISDPVIATEVLNRRDFDKEWQVYKSISKVERKLRHHVGGTRARGRQTARSVDAAAVNADDVAVTTSIPGPRGWADG